ncbi:replication protein RepB [Enterococcus cecorum]|nr:replication protein RepB [Enterococcus cecorum]CAI3471317.1 replication protein RepB [Enterococcus cecorum]
MVFRNVFIMGVLYMTKREKSRYFTFLIYEESVPDNYLELLEMLDVPMAISPWHDKDVKTKNLTPEEQKLIDQGQVIYKKKHRHCIYIANNPVTADSVRKKLQRLFAEYTDKSVVSTVKIIVTSVANTYAYLTHESKDAIAKKKHIYKSEDIVLLNNFDLSRYQVFDIEEKNDVLLILIEMIRVYRFKNIIDMLDYMEGREEKVFETLGVANKAQLLDVIKLNTGLLRLLFDGNYQKYKNSSEVDYEKGE